MNYTKHVETLKKLEAAYQAESSKTVSSEYHGQLASFIEDYPTQLSFPEFAFVLPRH